MGTGIWAMHFVGMAAFQLPVPVAYDLLHVGLSLLAAILACGIALFVVGRLMMALAVVLLGGVLMGAGIAAMHCIGMAAMRLSATIHYSVPWVTLSVALAIGISSLALWLTFLVRDVRWVVNWRKPVSAVVMGLAIPTMHYSGMGKILFLTDKQYPDYLRCLMLSGFKELLGDRIIDIPKIEHIYTNYSEDIQKLYGKGFSYTKIVEDLRRGPRR